MTVGWLGAARLFRPSFYTSAIMSKRSNRLAKSPDLSMYILFFLLRIKTDKHTPIILKTTSSGS